MDPKEQEALKEALQEAKFADFGREEIDGKMVFVASDETVDREGEKISIEGWKLENFKRNPVMLWAHNPFEPPIGKWTNIQVRNIGGKKKLTMTPDFHGKSDLSRLIRDLVEAGYPPQTTSVGFRAYEKQGNMFTKQELLETSFVSIPANPEATTLALSKGYKLETVKQLMENAEEPHDEEKVEEKMNSQLLEILQDVQTDIKSLREALVYLSNPAKPEKKVPVPVIKEQDRIKRLIQGANKSLDEVLRLHKHN